MSEKFYEQQRYGFNGYELPGDLLDAYICANTTMPQDGMYIGMNTTYYFLANRHDPEIFRNHGVMTDAQVIELGRMLQFIHASHHIPVSIGNWLLDSPEGADLPRFNAIKTVEPDALQDLLTFALSDAKSMLILYAKYSYDRNAFNRIMFSSQEAALMRELIEDDHFLPLEGFLHDALTLLETQAGKQAMRDFRTNLYGQGNRDHVGEYHLFSPIADLHDEIYFLSHLHLGHVFTSPEAMRAWMLAISAPVHQAIGIQGGTRDMFSELDDLYERFAV